MSKGFFSINNVLLAIFSLELLALTFRGNNDLILILAFAQILIYFVKIRTDEIHFTYSSQLQLPNLKSKELLVHGFNHYVLPLTQIIAVNLFFFTYESYQVYLIQIALNILLLSMVMRNTRAWLDNKFIIEAQTHYIYDITSTFILFNSFWGGTIFLTSYSNPLITAIVLTILYLSALLLTLLRYHMNHFSKAGILFVVLNLSFFFLSAYIWGNSLKFVAAITFSYYISLSALHHYLNKDFKWALVLEYAILTGIILILLY
jgi:hypothetical protein